MTFVFGDVLRSRVLRESDVRDGRKMARKTLRSRLFRTLELNHKLASSLKPKALKLKSRKRKHGAATRFEALFMGFY